MKMTSGENDMDKNIQVSVCCLAYNHGKYIRQTLEGFVNQKTDFAFEVLINDDASTDNTADIIREYQEKYPDIIKPMFQDENQYSKGIKVNLAFNYPRVKGKYVALCEGDDYWCDNEKLQKQFDIMEKNSECAICVHKVRWIDKEGKTLNGYYPDFKIGKAIISAEDYLDYDFVKGKYAFQTSSFFVRREVVDCCLNGFKHKFPYGDFVIILLSFEYGNCFYIDETMSCYRKDAGGATTRLRDDSEHAKTIRLRMIEGYKEFDERTKGKYHSQCIYAIDRQKILIYEMEGKYRETYKDNLNYVLKNMDTKHRLLFSFGRFFPKTALAIYQFAHVRNRNG